MGKLVQDRRAVEQEDAASRGEAKVAQMARGGRSPRVSPRPATGEHGSGMRRGAVLTLPVRDLLGGTALEPIGGVVPPVTGSLALIEAPEAEPEPASRPVAVRRHILIVEGGDRAAGLVRSALESDGEPDWGVEVARVAKQALELTLRRPPDLVLLDVRLPELDGAEVYRRLRAGCDGRLPRVLFLTEATSLDLYEHGIEDGVLLRKPFEAQELVGLVRAMLAE